MPNNDLPRFVIYQPNEKEFHICLEASGVYLRWCSKYAPNLNMRFPREVIRIEDMPIKKRPRKGIFDEGTYAITQSKKDSKKTIEDKITEGIDNKTFSFILKGNVLNGRFAIKRDRIGTVIQKFKDKYAKEEDILSGDLIRTINTMVPDYDESKVKLNRLPKTKPKQIPQAEVEPLEEVTADKAIGGIDYHFAFYTSDSEPDICVITSEDNAVLVLKKERSQWVLQSQVSKIEKELTKHAKALYELSNS